jgi:hypothetical protein
MWVTSRNAQRPRPPQLFSAGTQRSRAAATFAAFSFFASPETSRRRTIRRSEAFAAFDEPELREPAPVIEQLAGE